MILFAISITDGIFAFHNKEKGRRAHFNFKIRDFEYLNSHIVIPMSGDNWYSASYCTGPCITEACFYDGTHSNGIKSAAKGINCYRPYFEMGCVSSFVTSSKDV